jgi:hypothetical protein
MAPPHESRSRAIDEYIIGVFGDHAHPLAAAFADWMAVSPRFKAFADDYRGKIRKKFWNVPDEQARADLRCELQVAYLLLHEKRFAVEYERFGVGKQRGPDLTIIYRTHTPVNVEIKRLRPASQAADEPPGISTRLVNVLLDKAHQMPPGMLNILVVVAAEPYDETDLAVAAKLLKERADHKDDHYFARRRFADAREFLHYYYRLSAVCLCDLSAAAAPLLWTNKEARHPLPRDVGVAFMRCLATAS